MRIAMEWAMTKECSAVRPCEFCGAGFEPQSVMVCVDPHGFEICPECVRVLLKGERCGVRALWPTWESYQEALLEHPEPMMTEEECTRAEELGLYDDFFNLAHLA